MTPTLTKSPQRTSSFNPEASTFNPQALSFAPEAQAFQSGGESVSMPPVVVSYTMAPTSEPRRLSENMRRTYYGQPYPSAFSWQFAAGASGNQRNERPLEQHQPSLFLPGRMDRLSIGGSSAGDHSGVTTFDAQDWQNLNLEPASGAQIGGVHSSTMRARATSTPSAHVGGSQLATPHTGSSYIPGTQSGGLYASASQYTAPYAGGARLGSGNGDGAQHGDTPTARLPVPGLPIAGDGAQPRNNLSFDTLAAGSHVGGPQLVGTQAQGARVAGTGVSTSLQQVSDPKYVGVDGKLIQQASTRLLRPDDLVKLIGNAGNRGDQSSQHEPLRLMGRNVVYSGLPPLQLPTTAANRSQPPHTSGCIGISGNPVYGPPLPPGFVRDPESQIPPPPGFGLTTSASQPHGGWPLQENVDLDISTTQYTNAPGFRGRGGIRGARGARRGLVGGFVRSTSRRTDQGPGPSDADIYPEDAGFGSSAPPGPQHGFNNAALSLAARQPDIATQQTSSWPTPAEVAASIAAPAARPQPPTIPGPNPHKLPAWLINDPDVAPILQHPDRPAPPEFAAVDPTQINLSTVSEDMMTPQARPLSPDQETGARYGLQLQGMGHGAAWQPAPAAPGQDWAHAQFRVRPLDHPGWGGREWGMANGWAELGE